MSNPSSPSFSHWIPQICLPRTHFFVLKISHWIQLVLPSLAWVSSRVWATYQETQSSKTLSSHTKRSSVTNSSSTWGRTPTPVSFMVNHLLPWSGVSLLQVITLAVTSWALWSCRAPKVALHQNPHPPVLTFQALLRWCLLSCFSRTGKVRERTHLGMMLSVVLYSWHFGRL